MILLPVTILGMFLGGFLIKKFKLHITEMAKFACITFIVAYLLNLLYFTCSCEVLQVAGLTAPYSGFVSPQLWVLVAFVTAASLGVMHRTKSWVLRRIRHAEVMPKAGDGKNMSILFFEFCLNWKFLFFLNSLFLFPKFLVADNIPIYSGKLQKKRWHLLEAN